MASNIHAKHELTVAHGITVTRLSLSSSTSIYERLNRCRIMSNGKSPSLPCSLVLKQSAILKYEPVSPNRIVNRGVVIPLPAMERNHHLILHPTHTTTPHHVPSLPPPRSNCPTTLVHGPHLRPQRSHSEAGRGEI